MKKVFVSQKKIEQKEKWDKLFQRLCSLLHAAESSKNAELVVKITKKIAVMKRNDPSDKVYSSILNFADSITLALNKGDRER